MNVKANYKYIHFIAINLFLLCCIPSSLVSQESPSEEALHVRRILEFWKDRETSIVKHQIKLFITEYPRSEYVDSLLVILGDTYWNEQNYDEALIAYDFIKSPHLKEKVFNNRLDCLYHQQRHDELALAVRSRLSEQPLQPENSEQALWMYYYAEALMHKSQEERDLGKSAEYLAQAKAYYSQLKDTDHKINACLALGEIERKSQNTQAAYEIYAALAEALPEKKNEMLLLAAQLQTEFSPREAMQAYTRIMNENGKDSSRAALGRLLLQFELGEYQQIIDDKENYRKNLDPKDWNLYDFYLGRSYLALNRYEEAAHTLQAFVNKEKKFQNQDASIDKAILLALISCSYQMQDFNRVKGYAKQFQSEFPNDPALPKVLYTYASACRMNECLEESLATLDRLIKYYPDYENIDVIEFDRALTLFKLGRWKDSRTAFKSYIGKYPGTESALAALQYIPGSTLQLLEENEKAGNPCLELQNQLLRDMHLVLENPDAVDDSQRPNYLLKAGKTLYDLKRYEEAIQHLKEMEANFPDDPHLFQTHLLLAMCHHDGLQDWEGFTGHAEKVLEHKPDFNDQNRLRMNLFSVYMRMAKSIAENNTQADKEQHDELINKAAEHLYQVLTSDYDEIKSENQFWLANHFYNKIRSQVDDYIIEPLQDSTLSEYAKRAASIYRKVLGVNNNKFIEINPEHLYLEQELFKLSNVAGWLNDRSAQIALLEDLVFQQNANPKQPWSLRSRSVFALANALEANGDRKQALDKYRLLTSAIKSTDPYVANASKLHWARLAYRELPESKRTLDNCEMMDILKSLKDLQIRKSLAQEPIHLEAAIDYADIRASLETEEKRDEQLKFLLLRAKEDFTSRNDLWSKDYYASRQLLPEKDFIYQAYMLLIDAHIIRLEALLAEKNGRSPEKEVKNEAATSIYKSLIKGKFAVSKYLVDQAKSGLKAITDANP